MWQLGKTRGLVLVAVGVVTALALGGCAWFDSEVDTFLSLMRGRSATIVTYNVFGNKIDSIHGTAINISRDTTFDSVNSDGTTNKDSSVLRISVGNAHVQHVGSTLLLIEDGVINVGDQLPKTVSVESTERATPFLNDLRQRFQNLWQGRSRTVIVRSQNGSPIAIFAGNQVEYFATDVPKSTLLRIDGKYLLVYRSDYTIYDNALLR
jgi:hypothetical protein